MATEYRWRFIYMFMIKLHNSKKFTVDVQQRIRKEGTFDAPTIRISVTLFLIPYKKRLKTFLH
jgi:hypothetical protein